FSISNIKEARLTSRKSAVDCRVIFDRISFCCSETEIDGDLGAGIFESMCCRVVVNIRNQKGFMIQYYCAKKQCLIYAEMY
ncbi:MAG: hypothetical protein D3906_07850, partial [Candidatus Electrothrix sp. AUS1_2]|nr:hypothetical protein [Candidatus Electrothrix sp. AUS1_2]